MAMVIMDEIIMVCKVINIGFLCLLSKNSLKVQYNNYYLHFKWTRSQWWSYFKVNKFIFKDIIAILANSI